MEVIKGSVTLAKKRRKQPHVHLHSCTPCTTPAFRARVRPALPKTSSTYALTYKIPDASRRDATTKATQKHPQQNRIPPKQSRKQTSNYTKHNLKRQSTEPSSTTTATKHRKSYTLYSIIPERSEGNAGRSLPQRRPAISTRNHRTVTLKSPLSHHHFSASAVPRRLRPLLCREPYPPWLLHHTANIS